MPAVAVNIPGMVCHQPPFFETALDFPSGICLPPVHASQYKCRRRNILCREHVTSLRAGVSFIGEHDVTVAVSRVTNKGSEQLEQIFREHYRLVYRTAYSILGNSEDAEDVLQTIFLRLLRREFDSGFQQNLRGYLYRAAVNLSLNTIRTRQRYELSGDLERFEGLFEPPDEASAERTHRRLAEAIAQLDAAATHIVILRYVENMSDAGIARLLGVSRVTVAVRLFRARARLKKIMRDSMGEE